MAEHSGIPSDLFTAFEEYERAILSDDLDALDDAFAPGPATLRGDAAGLLVGHDAISAFRSVRGGVPPRKIERIEYRPIGPDAAVLVSVARYAGGGTGLQTQVWQRLHGRWLITAAHVTPRAQALDRSVWRMVGDPLWQGAWEGPLAGLTVAVKDLFAIKGYRIGAGNPAFLAEARAETTTAPAVGDLLRGARRSAASPAPTNSRTASPATTPTTAPRRTALCPAPSPAGRRADRHPRSRPGRPTSALRPTPPGRCGCRPRTRGSGACVRRTGWCPGRASFPLLSRSIRSGG